VGREAHRPYFALPAGQVERGGGGGQQAETAGAVGQGQGDEGEGGAGRARIGERDVQVGGAVQRDGAEGELGRAQGAGAAAGASTAHAVPPHSAPVIPRPSAIVYIRSAAGSFTVSFAPEGQ